MNLTKLKKQIFCKMLLAVLLFTAGFICIGFIGVEMMDVPKKYIPELDKTIYIANNSFQPAVLVTVLGCMLLTVSNILFFDVIKTLRHSRYESFSRLSWCRLPFLGIFALNLSFFTSSYFQDMTRLKLEKDGRDVYLHSYAEFNYVFSQVLFIILLAIMIINTGKRKIKYFGTVVSLLAIIQSAIGIVTRTLTVRWLWLVYSIAMAVMLLVILIISAGHQRGYAPAGKDDKVTETVAFFVSPHGFGHIFRTVPVIAELLKNSDSRVLLVTAEEHAGRAKAYLSENTGLSAEELESRFAAEVMNTDFGIAVKPGSLEIDVETVRKGVEDFVGCFDVYAKKGVGLIEKYGVSIVVSDICPWALISAEKCGIPSFLMASFTWIEIYEEYFPESLISPFRACYHLADRVLLYELANKVTRTRFSDGIQVGYTARKINKEKAEKIKRSLSGRGDIVFVSVGLSNSGIDEDIYVGNIPCMFIATKGVRLSGDNVITLPDDCKNTQDYVAASDYCIIKSGWTTVAECMIAGKPMALIGRDDVAEDRMTIEMLTEGGFGIKIEPEEVGNMTGVIWKIRNSGIGNFEHENDAGNIAEKILGWREEIGSK